MQTRPLVEIAGELKITDDQLRYWLKLAGFKPVKIARNLCLTAEMVGVMRQASELVSHGVTPSAAVKQIGRPGPEPTDVPAVQVTPAPVDLSPLSGRLSLLEKGVLALCEQNACLVEANRSLLEEVAAIRAENAAMRSEFRAMLPAPVQQAAPSFGDELRSATDEIKAFVAGIFSPFSAWFKTS